MHVKKYEQNYLKWDGVFGNMQLCRCVFTIFTVEIKSWTIFIIKLISRGVKHTSVTDKTKQSYCF